VLSLPVTSGGSSGRCAPVELAGLTRTLAWRAPLAAAAAGLAGQVLAAQVGLPRAGLAGLAVAALVGWRLRFRLSEQAHTWQRAPPASGAPPASWTGSAATAT